MSIFRNRTPRNVSPPASASAPAATKQTGLSLTELAKATGRHITQLCKWARRPGFPLHENAGGENTFDLAPVQRWIASNIQSRAKRNTRPRRSAIMQADDPLMKQMQGGSMTQIELARANVRIAVLVFVRAYQQSDSIGLNETRALCNALQELRASETAAMKQAIDRHDLVHKEHAIAVMAQLPNALVRGLERFSRGVGLEFEQWMLNISDLPEADRVERIKKYINGCFEPFNSLVAMDQAKRLDDFIDQENNEQPRTAAGAM